MELDIFNLCRDLHKKYENEKLGEVMIIHYLQNALYISKTEAMEIDQEYHGEVKNH
jgi:hypothetical protein